MAPHHLYSHLQGELPQMNRFRLSVLLLVAGLSLALGVASAQIDPGYDLFQTGSGASVDLSSQGFGVVPLAGVPIQGSTGNTDTMVHRTDQIPAAGGTSQTNVYALLFKSTQTVTVNGQTADVWVTINNSGGAIPQSVVPQPDSLSGSTGSVTVRSDGTFDSSLTVNADLIFVAAGGNPANSADVLASQAAPAISLGSSNSTWSSTPPSGYPAPSAYRSGGFHPIHVQHRGPHPVIPSSCSTGTATATRLDTRGKNRDAVAISPTPVQFCLASDTRTLQ